MKIDLSRYTRAHKESYRTALLEIQNGRKASHWMWYIFPQIRGLGRSSTSEYYAIQNLEEAKAFLQDSYLGGNLVEISRALLALDISNPSVIFGNPDDKKLRSSMTLFASISGPGSVFHQVLKKFFGEKMDNKTLIIIGRNAQDFINSDFT